MKPKKLWLWRCTITEHVGYKEEHYHRNGIDFGDNQDELRGKLIEWLMKQQPKGAISHFDMTEVPESFILEAGYCLPTE